MGPTKTSTPDAASQGGALEGEARISRLFEMTSDLLATISRDGRFTLLNPAWEQLLGWTREELLSRPIQDFMHPEDVQQTLALLVAGEERPAQLEHFTNRYRHRDGSWRWLMWSARCDGDTWYAAAKDVTDRMWLERQALHDPLTRLPNRLLLMDRARQALTRLHRSRSVVALLFVDLDRFKAVNDNLGHEIGDQLLIAISDRRTEIEAGLRDALPQHELVLAYQPIVPLAGGLALGAEALVRWRPHGVQQPREAEMLPGMFLPSAEDSDLIVQIGNWVLHSACAQ